MTSAKATTSQLERLSLDGLEVEDVGRLSLAAAYFSDPEGNIVVLAWTLGAG